MLDNAVHEADSQVLAADPFAALGLSDSIATVVKKLGFTTPTPIQAAAIPVVLAGRDVVAQAETGSGKTGAFALPILQKIDTSITAVQALILTPTRELAQQVAKAIESFATGDRRLRVATVYGGESFEPQFRALRAQPQIVVGTPGRTLDHMRRETLSISQLRFLILDEADEMLTMGFKEEVDAILSAAPSRRQTVLFSATMPPAIRELAKQHLREETDIKIASKTKTATSIDQRHVIVSGKQRIETLERLLLGTENDGVLVFCRTKTSTIELAEALSLRGFSCTALNGDMKQADRDRAVEDLRSGKRKIVVATDVAARGIDVSRITHVINYDFPSDPETYVHRIGRTGRAGRAGTAVLFVNLKERNKLRILERITKSPIPPIQVPSRYDIQQQRVQELKDAVVQRVGLEQLALYREVISSVVAEHGLAVEDVAAGLLAVHLKSNPLIGAPRPREEARESLPRETQVEEFERRKLRRERSEPTAFSDSTRGRERPQRTRESPRDLDEGRVVFSLDGGRQHGVTVAGIVSAVAQSTGLFGREIGNIRIFEQYSTILMPEGLDPGAIKRLRKTWIQNQCFAMRPGSYRGAASDRPKRPMLKDKKKGKERGKGSTFPFGEQKKARGKKEIVWGKRA